MILQFRGKIPIAIYPAFWLFAALIGFINSRSFVGTLIWIGIILISVLFHELGHAITALVFKQKPRIELVALGGLTYHEGRGGLPLWKQFLIVFNGPLFGFLLVIGSTLLMQIPSFSTGAAHSILSLTRLVNLFWTVVNLLPVLPLDGGQLMRIVLEKFFGAKALRYSIIASLSVATLISLFFFLTQEFLVGALFFLFAFQSYDLLRKSRHFAEVDRQQPLKQDFEALERALQEGNKSVAADLCLKIRSKVQQGMIFETATQYLALIKSEEGLWKEVYDLLAPLKGDLTAEMLCLLQKAAFHQKHFAMVKELAGPCFQVMPSVETALRNALAHAQLKEPGPSLGWVQTAQEEGLSNIQEILKDPLFDPIRSDPSFATFLQTNG
ncbi:MAG: hypothetical protein RLZZ453_176 [Chlamydiota bacterium]|jgi:Zn-dependent protease